MTRDEAQDLLDNSCVDGGHMGYGLMGSDCLDCLREIVRALLSLPEEPARRWEDEAIIWFEDVADACRPAASNPETPDRETWGKSVMVCVSAAELLRNKKPTSRAPAQAGAHASTGKACPRCGTLQGTFRGVPCRNHVGACSMCGAPSTSTGEPE